MTDPQPSCDGEVLIRREALFLSKIHLSGDCWVWHGVTFGKKGQSDKYGMFFFKRDSMLAHRWAYEHFIEPIPKGLTIDHLCRNSLCVNPFHLEPCTIGENVRRGGNSIKTKCKNGHEAFSKPIKTPTGTRRYCVTCVSIWNKQRRKRVRDLSIV